MSSSEKQSPVKDNKKNSSATKEDAVLASKNNNKLANFVFNFMTVCILFGSVYLYNNLHPYMEKVTAMNPGYQFPEFSDYFIAFAGIPVFFVCLNLKF